MARNLDTKRSASAPPKTQADKGDPKGGGKKICYEFKKSGTCKKGADCAYEHVAAAPAVGKPKRKASPRLVHGTPAISIFEMEPDAYYPAVNEDINKQVTFAKQKLVMDLRTRCKKDVTHQRTNAQPHDPRVGRIHARVALLRARILKNNLTSEKGDPRRNFIRSTAKCTSMTQKKKTARPVVRICLKLSMSG